MDGPSGRPVSATLAVAYLGLGPTAVAYVTWTYALSRTTTSTAASGAYLLPVLAFLIAWVWLGEAPTLVSVAGDLVAIAGVTLVALRGKRVTGA